MIRTATIFVILVVLGVSTTTAQPTVTGDTRVYYGQSGSFSNPAEVSAAHVFAEIDEYKQIAEEGLTPDDPLFWSLIEKANRTFHRAVKRSAKRLGYDLVAEAGSIETEPGDPQIPDITAAVIRQVKSSQ